MNKFIKSEITKGEYAMYQGKFVARFKYSTQRRSQGSFITFLCKNFTVEEYFSRLDAGQSPLDILQSKGYMSPHVKKLLIAAGYAPTPEGEKLYIEAAIQKRLAA